MLIANGDYLHSEWHDTSEPTKPASCMNYVVSIGCEDLQYCGLAIAEPLVAAEYRFCGYVWACRLDWVLLPLTIRNRAQYCNKGSGWQTAGI